jgi:hypothetical protein
LTLKHFIQFIHVFPTDLAAKEYVRVRIEEKLIGEEGAPLYANSDEKLCRQLKSRLKTESSVKKLHVLKSTVAGNSLVIVAAVRNVAIKVFVGTIRPQWDACLALACAAIQYLDRMLHLDRMIERHLFSEAANEAYDDLPDETMCAYCGKIQSGSLKGCGKCQVAKYCGSECQKKHWQMKPHGHKKFCKIVSENARGKSG